MAARCCVCSHPERALIDRQLLVNTSIPVLVKAYGLAKDPLYRHKENHLGQRLVRASSRRVKAMEGETDTLLSDLLGQIDDAQGRTLRLLDVAEEGKKLTSAAQLLQQLRSNVELMARLQGLLREGNQVQVAVILNQSPEWQDLRAKIVAALQPYPEARQAVLAAIAGPDVIHVHPR